MDAKSERISRLLQFDPLDTAERITGKHYAEDDPTVKLGMALAWSHGAVKDRILKEFDDTCFSNRIGDYLRIAKDIGFKIVLAEEFIGHDSPETLYVLFHDGYGILLSFDTFGGDGVNGGNFYYNIMPHEWIDIRNRYGVTSSGKFTEIPCDHVFGKEYAGDDRCGDDHTKEWGFLIQKRMRKCPESMLWSGGHDCREALRHKIKTLASWGEFISPWRDQPFLWLLHYMDTKDPGYSYGKINAERIAKLPQYIRERIGA